jgi:feruloyl esterase
MSIGTKLRRACIGAFTFGVSAGFLPSLAYAGSCQSFEPGQVVGKVTILGVQEITGGSFNVGWTGPRVSNLPDFCRIIARSRPSSESNIIIEVWLPTRDAWNGKYLGTGNGGYAGSIVYDALAGGLRRGFAVANTDMGTYPAGLSLNYGAGNGRRDPSRDWGYRATHEMTVFAKKVVRTMYDKPARLNYFTGCSTGGRQGLMEAQRFPDDYDAILAGAPGYNSTHQHASWTSIDLLARKSGVDFGATLNFWNENVLKACVGKDGGLPNDAYLTQPLACQIQPKDFACRQGFSTNCLNSDQISVLDSLEAGTRNLRTGEMIYPPYAKGAALADRQKFSPPKTDIVTTDFHRWVFGPHWDEASFDFDKDMDRVDRVVGKIVNAMETDLTPFAKRGGKLIIYHGWLDSAISPLDSINYFDRLTAQGKNRSDFARLFMIPGMGHCSGGPGLDGIGQELAFPEGDAQNDILAAMDRWAEGGKAPEIIVATKLPSRFGTPPLLESKAQSPSAKRPICAYPMVAHYNGAGDPSLADSFSCQIGSNAKTALPAPRYLR